MKCNAIFFRSFSVVLCCVITLMSSAQEGGNMALIKGGLFTPFYGGDTIKERVKTFKIDLLPVTNADFLSFVKKHPKWRKSKVIQLFADTNYLFQFADDLHLKKEVNPSAPATNVSWFAAKSYCTAKGKRLPKIAEWEYVAMAGKTHKDGREVKGFNQYILSWYEKRGNPYHQSVKSTFKNYWGVWDMYGLVWEWTKDYNSILVSTDSGNGLGNQFVCGGASVNATDPGDYAAFMRYAFRSSLKAKYCIKNLGFRCAQTVDKIIQ